METLAFLQPNESILLISESSLIKSVTNLLAITQTLTQFDIEETSTESLSNKHSNVTVIHDKLAEIMVKNHAIRTETGSLITYKYLCLCMGAKPKLIPEAGTNPNILGIRDTDSVENFVKKLEKAKRVAIVGNGGIASELVYKIQNTHVDWVVKDNHIASTFVDPGAAEFFQFALTTKKNDDEYKPLKRIKYEEEGCKKFGAALGPDWYKHFNIIGDNVSSNVTIHYKSTVNAIKPLENALELVLSNGEVVESDLVVSATGVAPRIEYKIDVELVRSEEDHGIKVNEFMQTNVPNIFAAGDICTADWKSAKHWFQMKLWTQARQMGGYAAKCMSAFCNNETIYQDFCFELFAHTTKLFGYKVVLIGLFNGQKLGVDYEILLRMTKGVEYVKFVLQNGKLQGAILIGDTDLEETCENLILNEIDLSEYKEDLLNPDIDIEDYFD